jgi:hypothetical protein
MLSVMVNVGWDHKGTGYRYVLNQKAESVHNGIDNKMHIFCLVYSLYRVAK